MVSEGSYQDTLYCFNAQSDLTTDADHRLLEFNHLEAHDSFNWYLVHGADFKVKRWLGGEGLDYPWTTPATYHVS